MECSPFDLDIIKIKKYNKGSERIITKLLFRIAFYLLLPALCISQAPDTAWSKTYGHADYDNGYSVLITSDGGYIIAGYAVIAGDTASVIKVDSLGSIMWTKYYYTTVTQVFTDIKCIQQTVDSGYMLNFSDHWKN